MVMIAEPTWTQKQMRILKGLIFRDTRTATSLSARAFISALATNLHASKANVRWKLCSGGGRSLPWRFSQQTSGGASDLALGP